MKITRRWLKELSCDVRWAIRHPNASLTNEGIVHRTRSLIAAYRKLHEAHTALKGKEGMFPLQHYDK